MSLAGAPNNADGSFDWGDAVADSLIIAMVTFFSALSASSLAGIPSQAALMTAGLAAAAQFSITLAIKRGLRRPREKSGVME